MPKKNKKPCADWEDYVAVKSIGHGGNGEVWLFRSRSTSREVAIKFLHSGGSRAAKRYERFKSEVRVLKELEDAGVVSLLEFHLPQRPTRHDRAWFAMPLCRRLEPGDLESISDKVRLTITVAKTLARLHKKGIYHRDLKRENLLMLDGHVVLSDFGLAEWSDAPDVTEDAERVGAYYTMAPEMRRTAKNSNGGPADVYSLAKVLWGLIAGDASAFDGQYSLSAPGQSIELYCRELFLAPLHQLLEDCTEHDPKRRPTMSEVADRLEEWLAMEERGMFHEQCLIEWQFVFSKLFPRFVPHRAVWSKVEEIVEVLNLAVAKVNLNHCFLPGGGGLDLESCSLRSEGTVLFLFGPVVSEARPILLEAVFWESQPECSYFWLELGTLSPSNLSEGAIDQFSEEIVELPNGDRYGRDVWETGVISDAEGREFKLPRKATLITRYFGGAFAIVGKTSPYNMIQSTYDARHQEMGRERFYEYIDELQAGLG